MVYRVEWSRRALERLLEIAEFIWPGAEKRGQDWMSEVLEAAESLSVFPRRGGPIDVRGGAEIRRLAAGRIEVVYEVRSEVVYILTIRHQREERDLGSG